MSNDKTAPTASVHGSCSTAFAESLRAMIAESKQYDSCMSVAVSEEGVSVELLLDTSIDTYSEWIEGEGADIGLIRCQETKRVVGVTLPLLRRNLCVHHDGPIRINAGFRKGECP